MTRSSTGFCLIVGSNCWKQEKILKIQDNGLDGFNQSPTSWSQIFPLLG